MNHQPNPRSGLECRFLQRLSSDPNAIFPARPLNAAGEKRRVGVEIEFSGIDLEGTVATLVEKFDGAANPSTDYECTVEVPELGELRIEVDDARLKELGRAKLASGEQSFLDASHENLRSSLAGKLTPIELVTGPLEVNDLAMLDRIVEALGEAGAMGTDRGVFSAFGTHFNPEVPSAEPEDLLNHLRAFVLLFDWLCEELDVDLTRKLTPFVDRFPASYSRAILAQAAPASLEEVVRDYLAENPTRNRALDMLPCFAHFAPKLVDDVPDHTLVKARPTFHYRLTNSRVGEPGWRVSRGWRLWLIVEDLANDGQRLRKMTEEHLRFLDASFLPRRSAWVERTRELLS